MPKSTPPPHSWTSKGSEGVKTICCPNYSPDIDAANFFLFRNVKSELAGLLLSQDSFKTIPKWVVGTITQDELADTFLR
jgi:hypothetical protein